MEDELDRSNEHRIGRAEKITLIGALAIGGVLEAEGYIQNEHPISAAGTAVFLWVLIAHIIRNRR